jgi:hypothetical protein
MLLSIQEIFPTLDTVVVQSINTNKFQARHLLKLKASFTYKKKHTQLYFYAPGDVEIKEYQLISDLMRPFMVYIEIICTFAPPPQKLSLVIAMLSYGHTIYNHLRTTYGIACNVPHRVPPEENKPRSIRTIGWGTPDFRLETAQLFKRIPAGTARPTK